MEFTGLLFGVIKSVGESCSAFCASSLENLAAVSRAHSFSEAVNLFTLDFLRLICSFHLSHLLLVFVKDILLQLHRLLYTETYRVVKHYFYFCAKFLLCFLKKRRSPILQSGICVYLTLTENPKSMTSSLNRYCGSCFGPQLFEPTPLCFAFIKR